MVYKLYFNRDIKKEHYSLKRQISQILNVSDAIVQHCELNSENSDLNQNLYFCLAQNKLASEVDFPQKKK